MIKRVSWPAVWMNVAHEIAERSYDPRRKVGAIIVSGDNTQVLSVGYNGNYKGGSHEPDSLEPGKSGFIHAEVNALLKCDFNSFKEKHMYVTTMPCINCAKCIINAGIDVVVYDETYRDQTGVELLMSVGIVVRSLNEAILIA